MATATWMRRRRYVVAIIAVLIAAAVALLLVSADARAPAPRGPPLAGRFGGVNLAGGEFKAKRLPGRYGVDYSYPDADAAAPFLAAGFDAVRMPVRWERIQPAAMQPLDEREMERVDRALERLKGFRVVIVDVHNYARYRGQRPDEEAVPGAMLADLWTRLAERYRTDPRVAFGMMNEPFKISAGAWREVADRTLAAIRRTGARNLVLVPGTRWTGAHSWTRGGPLSNAAAMAGFRDPANNFAFEFHQYLDANSSGTSETCVAPEKAAGRLVAVTDWLRRDRARGVLAEFGASADPNCLAGLEAMMRAVSADSDVWLGWTYWAAGKRWGRYAFSIQPGAEGPDARMRMLSRYLP